MLTKLLCEFGATALMIIFGVGVHCDTVLKGTKYQGSGHMFAITTWSFGISVCLFVFGGAVCMNPAMVLAQCIVGLVPWGNCIPFMLADMLGGFVGAVIAWFMYADEFKASEGAVDPIAQRNIFSTNPTTEGTNYARNFFCEAICTFVFIRQPCWRERPDARHLRRSDRLGRWHGHGRHHRLRHEPGS